MRVAASVQAEGGHRLRKSSLSHYLGYVAEPILTPRRSATLLHASVNLRSELWFMAFPRYV